MTQIRFDRSTRSVLVLCSCGARDVFTNQASADTWALHHAAIAHPAAAARVTASLQRRHARAARAQTPNV